MQSLSKSSIAFYLLVFYRLFLFSIAWAQRSFRWSLLPRPGIGGGVAFFLSGTTCFFKMHPFLSPLFGHGEICFQPNSQSACLPLQSAHPNKTVDKDCFAQSKVSLLLQTRDSNQKVCGQRPPQPSVVFCTRIPQNLGVDGARGARTYWKGLLADSGSFVTGKESLIIPAEHRTINVL